MLEFQQQMSYFYFMFEGSLIEQQEEIIKEKKGEMSILSFDHDFEQRRVSGYVRNGI